MRGEGMYKYIYMQIYRCIDMNRNIYIYIHIEGSGSRESDVGVLRDREAAIPRGPELPHLLSGLRVWG